MTTLLLLVGLYVLIMALSGDKKTNDLLNQWTKDRKNDLELLKQARKIAEEKIARQEAREKRMQEIEDAVILNETTRINLKSIREKKQETPKKRMQEIEDAVILNEIKFKRKVPPPPELNPHPLKDYLAELQEELKKAAPKNNERVKEWSLELLLSLEWKRFEEVCREYLIAKGYDARLTKNGADGGIDIKVYKNNQVASLIQCKAWVWKIGVKEIRELYGIMASEQVSEGIFITTSTFSHDAIDFSQNKKITLVDGKGLMSRIETLSEDQQGHLLNFATAGDYTTPTCARCNQKMVKRINSQGKEFWGCINFPRCKSTIQMRKNSIQF